MLKHIINVNNPDIDIIL